MQKRFIIPLLALLALALALHSCQKEKVTIPDEPVKDISGSWKIIKATRNGTDLTNRFDFSRFRISFSDSTYSISNPVPFIVARNGSWHFDDGQYPFVMNFRATGDTLKSSEIQYPVTKGVRNIIIAFSPGCPSNSYQYTLEKED